MTQIEFYSVDPETVKMPYSHLCELIKRAYRRGQKIFVHSQNKSQAEKVDELLWTLDNKSFIPHQLVNEDPDTMPPVEIGFGQEPTIKPDVLINLSTDTPHFFSRFKWVFEYAYGDESNKEKAREKFRFYRERGYPINHRKI